MRRFQWSARWLFGLTVALLLAVGVLLTGCDADDEAAQAESNGEVVQATLDDYTIALDQKTAKAGKVHFAISNKGDMEHEFVVVKTEMAPDAFPVEDGKAAEPEAESEESGEGQEMEVEDIAPGADASLDLDLEAGKYVLICNLPGHYEQGMRIAFTVE
jgi:uncharacterized cupredoxin-like copper-binding protein